MLSYALNPSLQMKLSSSQVNASKKLSQFIQPNLGTFNTCPSRHQIGFHKACFQNRESEAVRHKKLSFEFLTISRGSLLPEKPSQNFSDGAPSSSSSDVVCSAVGSWQVLLVRSLRWWKHSRLSAFVGSGRSSGVLPFSSLLRCTFLLFLLFSHTDGYWVESVQLSEGLLWGKCWLACLRTVCFVAVVVVVGDGGLG